MQLDPKFIIFIFLKGIHASNKFKLIFKFSVKNSTLFVLLATIPPTLAAAFISTSGNVSLINFSVSSGENKFVSSLFDLKTLKVLFCSRTFETE